MNDYMASEVFRCVVRDGGGFDLVVSIAPPYIVSSEEDLSECARCIISMEPLMPPLAVGGVNSFQALCLALEYVRNVLKSFVADGGRIYWRDTDSPIDLSSSWFAPMPSIKWPFSNIVSVV